ncbi:UDP-N-acetylmuramoyl-L-alanine--D-glutamate ligase [uncultured Propionivibrio sp.]|uniref:UDP-N-acetylmuramoyl-L-alanine--D-glutamate ligase n=1 Tax=uncultured Propionivibrio sp. TaxID=426737 RepID=UPI0029C06AF7|nr:UDP-N-acetylmuramoyl-L-alanine--D-glutamate ligase [uncultured Propionivibrio sp.]
MNVRGKQVLVIGLGESGLAMARWLAREGAAVRVVDSRQAPPNAATLQTALPAAELVCGGFSDAAFAGIDLMAISPGVPVETPAVQAALARGVPLVSEIELFVWGVRRQAPASRLIAITGSNGKTTTTALTAHLLNSIGVTAVACGNISPSALDAMMAAQDAGVMPSAWVVELSSFQLETTQSLAADAATVLNVSEDHLDRHGNMAGYAAAKARVFAGARVRVLNRDDAVVAAWADGSVPCVSFGLDRPERDCDYGIDGGWIVRGGERLVQISALPISGLHNAANVMAAMALCEGIGIAPLSLVDGLMRFSGLAHRVEKVADVAGVTYFDDSKGTNVGATLAALQGLGRKVAIILGGEGKDQDFTPLRAALSMHGRAVALIGRDAGLIGRAIDGCGLPTQLCADMHEAVRWCAAQTSVGDAVLLSPACASFDMFRNYAHRAEVFIAAVRELAGGGN